MSVTINGGSTATYFQGWNSSKNPVASATQFTTTEGGITTTTTVKDVAKTETTTLYTILNNTVSAVPPVTGFTNVTPTICDTTGFPNVASLQDGVGKVNLTTANGDLQIALECNKDTTVGNAYLSGYTNGSLTKVINDLIVGAVNGRPTPEASFMNLYAGGYTPNPNLYTKNIIDLTPYSENSGTSYGGIALVTPRHIITVGHRGVGDGQQYIFTDKNGSTQTKTIIATGYPGYDISIGYLDSAVTGITPYSVLPANVTTATKIPLAAQYTGAYGIFLPIGIYGFTAYRVLPFGGGTYIRQMQLGVIANISGGYSAPGTNYNTLGNGAGVLTQAGTFFYSEPAVTNVNDLRYPYRRWFQGAVPGDSGSPTFLPTGLTTATGTPLTLFLGNQSTDIAATALSYYIPEINAAMNAIKAVGDTTVYALDVISSSTNTVYNGAVATTGAAWWNSFTSY
jgi:hypothetical protein